MSAITATETQTQLPKFSRYRSVRKAAAPATPVDVPAVPEDGASQLSRTPSRYLRTRRQPTQSAPPLPKPALSPPASKTPLHSQSPPLERSNGDRVHREITVQPKPFPIQRSRSTEQRGDHDFKGGPVQHPRPSGAATPRHESRLSRTVSNATRSPTTSIPKSYEAAREEARMILEGEYDRLQEMKEREKEKEKQRHVERHRDVQGPTLKQRPAPVQQPPPPPPPPPVFVDAPTLKVKRRIERTLPEKYYDAPKSLGEKQPSPERQLRSDQPTDARQRVTTKPALMVDAPISAAQKLVDSRKFDAPISAVNAGGRRVEIRMNNASRGITLPVTPATNPRDLLNSASVVMSENFDPRTSVLVESFSQLGLERPLRRYEHIRDVMNSWDADDQNHLTIMTESECHATGLERSEAPEEMPGRTAVQMYLSLRSGKWEKRWINLRADGQVTMSKHENDGEATNICHLSDFDVYTPTAKQRKKIRPPKKLCFAVKSQQKSAMFLEGINFVHFFATSEKAVADQWYTAVQTWRSWYLVHVLGEGNQTAQVPGRASVSGGGAEARPATAQSTESVPYQLGSFKPLLDFSDLNFDSVDAQANAQGRTQDNTTPKKPSVDLGNGRRSCDIGTGEAVRRGSRLRGGPPSSFPSKLFSDVEVKRGASLDNNNSTNNDSAFTGGGLLARSASTRRSQGGKPSGHGVVPGLPGKPLVDLTPSSEFAEGSLLRKLEAWSTNVRG